MANDNRRHQRPVLCDFGAGQTVFGTSVSANPQSSASERLAGR
ncbi:hypothetical protein HNP60_003715 [Sphingobium sp. B1D3A]|uniref:Uncharacterized protein n=1 Tax=Sphingobium lignivorans TaxID=2735886 RepID=A0ABR6NKU0_9SPHN|nr:hypothetical protein [Sphingobium lignivorans]